MPTKSEVKKAIEESILVTQRDHRTQEDLMGHGEWILNVDGQEVGITWPCHTTRKEAQGVAYYGPKGSPHCFGDARHNNFHIPTEGYDECATCSYWKQCKKGESTLRFRVKRVIIEEI